MISQLKVPTSPSDMTPELTGSAGQCTPADMIAFLTSLPSVSRPVISKWFRQNPAIETKQDSSPVTIADQSVECDLRAAIAARFPDDMIMGEEFASTGNQDSAYRWIIDPIDGTKSFIAGAPLFGTLVSLVKDGIPIIGIIDMPVLNERWVGCLDRPTLFNGKNVQVRSCTDIREAWLYATSPHMFQGDDFNAFERVREQVNCTLYGTDCYAYGLLANGTCDLVIEADMGIYDFCALVPIIIGAGGFMVDWQGEPLGLQSDGRVIAAGGQDLLETARNLLEK